MLKSLSIKNYALIDCLELEPSGRLNMITGETGAGKSIMLGAVGLLLGKRADTKTLLNPDSKCIVEGTFDISSYKLKNFFEKEDLDYEKLCIIRREISPSGKSRSFINDTPVLLEKLRILGSRLMDIHSQHDTLQLGDGGYQLGLIDGYGETAEEFGKYSKSYSQFLLAQKSLNELEEKSRELSKEADFNQFQLDELASLGLQTGEQEGIEEELELLENAEEIQNKAQETLYQIENEEFGALQSMRQILQGLQQLASLGSKFQPLSDRFQSLLIEFEDIVENLSMDSSAVEVDMGKLEELRERLSKIFQLQKKHGLNSVEELMALESELAETVLATENMDDLLLQARAHFEESRKEMQQLGESLSRKRKAAFKPFSLELSELLKGLGMGNAQIELISAPTEAGKSGLDKIEILFSANKGSEPQSLKKVASGGEFSRLLFAIKYIMAEKMAMPTLIFDEIDAGISGEVALQMVQMMKEMSRQHQIVCITHLPQVAGKGDAHFFVYKDDSKDKTLSKIRKLNDEDRVEELAKMIAGARPSSSAIESAKELLGP